MTSTGTAWPVIDETAEAAAIASGSVANRSLPTRNFRMEFRSCRDDVLIFWHRST